MKGAKDNNYARVEGILYNYPKVKVEIEPQFNGHVIY